MVLATHEPKRCLLLGHTDSPLPSRPCTQEANPNSVQRQLKLPEHHSVIACLLPPTVVQGRVLRSAVTHCYRGSTLVTFLQCTRCQCILFSLHSKEPSSCFLMMRMHSCLLIVMLLYRCIQWGSVSVHLHCWCIFHILHLGYYPATAYVAASSTFFTRYHYRTAVRYCTVLS